MSSFETDWKPVLEGKQLQPCALTAELVEDDIKPDPRKESERPWTVAGFREIVKNVPEARGAIAESVLAIWRLKQCEDRGRVESVDVDGWQDHLEAWLVRRACGLIGCRDSDIAVSQIRHADVCQAAGIRPLQFIVDYAVSAERKDLLPVKRFPLGLFPRLFPVKTRQKATQVAAGEPELPSYDVVMKDLVGESSEPKIVPPKKGKGKGKPQAIVLSSPEPSGDEAEVGDKRVLQDSPSRVEVEAKRSRKYSKIEAMVDDDDWYDLGDVTVEEDTPINTAIFPPAKNKVGFGLYIAAVV